MYSIEPIGYVKNNRTGTDDDFWGGVISEIIISKKISEKSILGITGFSHLEIIFYFHLADPSAISISSSHPRGNHGFPESGIFSQRKKARPNLLGTTIVRLQKAENNILTVEGLDAIDGTPVIDIKPVFREFLPREEVIQPEWVSDLMKDYWKR